MAAHRSRCLLATDRLSEVRSPVADSQCVVQFQCARASAHAATISTETKTIKKHNDGVVFVRAFAQHMLVSNLSLFGVHNIFTHKATLFYTLRDTPQAHQREASCMTIWKKVRKPMDNKKT